MPVRDKTKEMEESLRSAFKKWRKAGDYSLADVAKMLRGICTPQFLSQFERGETSIGYENGVRLDKLIFESQSWPR